MMVPVGRLVLLRTVPRSELVRAMSCVSVPALIGPVIGPPLGGLIVTYASWRWIFFINIPIGVIGVLLINLFIENFARAAAAAVRPWRLRADRDRPREPRLRLRDARPRRAAAVAAGGAAGRRRGLRLLYVRHARRVDHPIIDFALMRIPTYAAATIGGFLFRMGLGALPFLLPLMLQVGFGLTPLKSGLLTFASAAGAMTMKTSVDDDLPRLRFSHGARRQRGRRRRVPLRLCVFPADDAACRDLSVTARRRVFPLAADDQHQHAESMPTCRRRC